MTLKASSLFWMKVLQTVVIFFEGRMKRIEKAKARGDFKQYSMKNLYNSMQHFAKVLIFCKGEQAMNDIVFDLKDFVDMNPYVTVLEQKRCDSEYDRFEELSCFSVFLEKILPPIKIQK